jgi:aryl-alcohol dehydrogenase-like predicted oxidoreductase
MTTPAADFPVSRIGLGCVTFGREIDADRSFEIMDYAFANGINFFDTAATYGDGASERIVGRWLRTRGLEKHIIVETKVASDCRRGNVRDSRRAGWSGSCSTASTCTSCIRSTRWYRCGKAWKR